MRILLLVCPVGDDVESLLDVTKKVASALNGRVTALCVRREIAQKYYSPFSIQLGKSGGAEGERAVLEKVRAVLGEEVVRMSRGGEPVSQVLDEIEKEGYDMLIYSDINQGLTKKLAEYSQVPTLIHRGSEELSRILICTDGSEHSLKAVRFAGRLAEGLGSRVALLSVAREEGDTERARQALEKAGEVLGGVYSGEFEKKLATGRVRDVILRESAAHELIALAPRGLSKLKRVLMGHVSLHVLENAEKSVLLVR